MAGLNAICDGLEARLATISELNAYATEGGPMVMPAAVVITPEINYVETFGVDTTDAETGKWSQEFRVWVLVADQLSAEAIRMMRDFADATGALSVRAAIHADRTLGGVIDDCAVISGRPLNVEEVMATGHWGYEWTVKVLADRRV